MPANIEFRSYLQPQHKDLIWKKDIPMSFLEPKWEPLLKAILHYTRTLQDPKTMKCGIDLILRIIPYLLQLSFNFLSLAYLIHSFRISKLYCKAIKLKTEDELKVQF
jgi:hypothetical protein